MLKKPFVKNWFEHSVSRRKPFSKSGLTFAFCIPLFLLMSNIMVAGAAGENNNAPTAEIKLIIPNPAKEGDLVLFNGKGTDTDGDITAYNWSSDIDGQLNTNNIFSTSNLSHGNHTICFKVMDNNETWSEEVSYNLIINEVVIPNQIPFAEIISITPNPGTEGNLVIFNGTGTDPDGNITAYNWSSNIDGQLNTSDVFSTSNLSHGNHTIYFKVMDNNGTWSEEASYNLIINEKQAPVVHIDANPKEHISVNNPVFIKLNSSDTHPGSTELVIKNNNSVIILNKTITEDVVEGVDYTFLWNATGADREPVLSGTYFLFVNRTDAFGNQGSKSVVVTIDNEKPVINIDSIRGMNTADFTVYTNSMLKLNASVSGTPGNAVAVEFILKSAFTNFQRNVGAEFLNGKWTASFNLSSIPDDGNYTVSCTAADAAGNTNSTVSNVVVRLDRTAPEFSPVISRYNDTQSLLSVTYNELLAGAPVIEVNGISTSLVQENGSWKGIFVLNEGDYLINVSATDLAGNTGTSNSVAGVKNITISNRTQTLVSAETGTLITFYTTEDLEDTVIITESSSPLVNVPSHLIGVYFIDVLLGDNLKSKLSNATLTIPIDNTRIPTGLGAEDVTICCYNTTTQTWESLETRIQNISGMDCWIAKVEHFSTYAAMAGDTVTPILESVTPKAGFVFEQGTNSVEIRFDYRDDQTGINASSVEFWFGNSDVTNSEHTELTGEYTWYRAANLSAGTYTARVIVSDMVGNRKTFSTSFQIASAASGNTNNSGDRSSSGGSNGGSGVGGGSPELQSNVETKELSQQVINNRNHVKFEFLKNVTCVSSVEFDAKKTVGRTAAIAELLKTRSGLVTGGPDGIVYRHFNVWVGNAGFADSGSIENLTVCFKVENAWLMENKIPESALKLWIYQNKTWVQLPTEKIEGDEKYVYFKAKTPTFSVFSITGLQKNLEVEANSSDMSDQAPPFVNTSVEKKGSELFGESESSGENESSGTVPAPGIISVIGLLICACLACRKYRK